MESIGDVMHVDDTSTAISYAGDWQALIGSSRQWMQTVHGAPSVGSTATLSWRGTQVTVIGTVPVGNGSTISSYQLDDGASTSVTFECAPTAVFSQVFWDSGIVRDGLHTLVITNEGTTADFQLDEIDYVMSGQCAGCELDNELWQCFLYSCKYKYDNEGSHIPVGAIVGGVVGAVVIFFALVLAYMWWRRQQTNPSRVLNEKSISTPLGITDASAARPSLGGAAVSVAGIQSQNRPSLLDLDESASRLTVGRGPGGSHMSSPHQIASFQTNSLDPFQPSKKRCVIMEDKKI
ncbi:hypothetical protein BU17DRAFT_63753 [Hysterangium stoloniferum]|nr:hypothetical protein BU17DRAFT_63753 [Hysterangium stoloniferum]